MAQRTSINLALKTAILASAKTQREVAEMAGMHENTLSSIVRYRVNPTDAEQKAIAKVLRVPVSQLFTERAVA